MIGSGAGNAEDAARQRKWMAALTRASMPPRDTSLKSGPVSVSTVGLGHAKDEHITPSIIGTLGWSTRVPDARVGAHLSGIPDSTSALPRHEYRLRPHDVTAYCPPISPRRGTSTESVDAYFQRHLPDAPAEEAVRRICSASGTAGGRRRDPSHLWLAWATPVSHRSSRSLGPW